MEQHQEQRAGTGKNPQRPGPPVQKATRYLPVMPRRQVERATALRGQSIARPLTPKKTLRQQDPAGSSRNRSGGPVPAGTQAASRDLICSLMERQDRMNEAIFNRIVDLEYRIDDLADDVRRDQGTPGGTAMTVRKGKSAKGPVGLCLMEEERDRLPERIITEVQTLCTSVCPVRQPGVHVMPRRPTEHNGSVPLWLDPADHPAEDPEIRRGPGVDTGAEVHSPLLRDQHPDPVDQAGVQPPGRRARGGTVSRGPVSETAFTDALALARKRGSVIHILPGRDSPCNFEIVNRHESVFVTVKRAGTSIAVRRKLRQSTARRSSGCG